MDVDYSLYLVTDTPMVPEGLTVEDQVRKAVENGATVVQLREKKADTRDFVERAKKIHAITQKAGVPLVINDRLDVALAVGAEGIHVGQDDMDIATLRNNFKGFVGVSVNDVEETRQAIRDKVDYVGIGAVYGTATKDLRAAPIGVSGVRAILDVLKKEADYDIKSVAIGGVNHSNAQFVLFQSATPEKKLDGVAVVSCIMAQKDAAHATKTLADKIKTPGPWVGSPISSKAKSQAEIAEQLAQVAPLIAQKVVEKSPLLHHITNNVVKNVSANISIAAGGSPAMSESAPEFEDFSKVPSAALLLNMGTAVPSNRDMMKHAITTYNSQGRTVVFDPVGAGASQYRRDLVAELLDTGVFTVIKGNEGEITACAKMQGATVRGVDSVGSASMETRIAICKKLAIENHTTVLMTGAQDVLVEGMAPHRVLVFENGHEYLGLITGSGCMLGSLVSAFCTVHPEDPIVAASSALALYTIAAERAVATGRVYGPGSFLPALIDSVYELSRSQSDWGKGIKLVHYE